MTQVIHTTSTTWTVPAGMLTCIVECIGGGGGAGNSSGAGPGGGSSAFGSILGAGGGGGGGGNTSFNARGGGGGGGYSKKALTQAEIVSLGASVVIKVGNKGSVNTGGTGLYAGGSTGSAGGGGGGGGSTAAGAGSGYPAGAGGALGGGGGGGHTNAGPGTGGASGSGGTGGAAGTNQGNGGNAGGGGGGAGTHAGGGGGGGKGWGGDLNYYGGGGGGGINITSSAGYAGGGGGAVPGTNGNSAGTTSGSGGAGDGGGNGAGGSRESTGTLGTGGAGNGVYGATYGAGESAVSGGGSNGAVIINYTVATAQSVTTGAVAQIGSTTARGVGNITALGGQNADKRGFVYHTASHGAPGNVAPGSSGYGSYVEQTGNFGTGLFNRKLTGLTLGVTYYVRAYSHNNAGYVYGSEVSFVATAAPAVRWTIATVDRTDNVNHEATDIQRAITSQVDTAYFEVVRNSSGGYKPALNDVVEAEENGTVIFAGRIVEMEEAVDASAVETFKCTCKDFSYDMDKHLVVGRYESQTGNAIIADVAANFLDTDFDISLVSCPIVIDYIAFNYELPSRVFQQLAELTNSDWYVDEDKKIHFFVKEAMTAPFGLTDTNGMYYYNSLKVKNNITNLRNTIIVRGGQYLGALTAEIQVADGQAIIYTQGYQYDTVYVKVDGVSKTVGVDNVDDPTLFDCLYNFQEKFVRFPSATKPAATKNVEVGGFPYVPVFVKVADPASVALYGEHEFKIVDKTINTREGARSRARAELVAYASKMEDGYFETKQPGLEVGQKITVQSTLRGVNTDYVISRIASSQPKNGTEFLHKVTLMTARTYGMIEFLMQLLMQKDKEITITDDEVLETGKTVVESATAADTATPTALTNAPPSIVRTLDVSFSNTSALNSVSFDATGCDAIIICVGRMETISSIDYNGSALTLDKDLGNSQKTRIYRLNSPATGSHNLNFNGSGGLTNTMHARVFGVSGINTADALEATTSLLSYTPQMTLTAPQATNTIWSIGFMARFNVDAGAPSRSYTPDNAQCIEDTDEQTIGGSAMYQSMHAIFSRAGNKPMASTYSTVFSDGDSGGIMALYNGKTI